MATQMKSPLPLFKAFEEKFRKAFGRELTREERRFYRLTGIVLAEDFITSHQLASDSVFTSTRYDSNKKEATGWPERGFIHDLNNLLHVIIGHIELLEQAVAKDPKALHHTLTIKQAANDAASLTRPPLAHSGRQSQQETVLSLDEGYLD